MMVRAALSQVARFGFTDMKGFLLWVSTSFSTCGVRGQGGGEIIIIPAKVPPPIFSAKQSKPRSGRHRCGWSTEVSVPAQQRTASVSASVAGCGAVVGREYQSTASSLRSWSHLSVPPAQSPKQPTKHWTIMKAGRDENIANAIKAKLELHKSCDRCGLKKRKCDGKNPCG